MKPIMVVFSGMLLFVCAFTAAATEVPFLAGHVNDGAGILTQATIASLEARLKAHEDSTSNQVVVLTITSLEDEPIESYSIRVADTWKLGQKGKDNGVLIVVARNDRKIRIEVGRGLEGDLTDATCGIIIRKEILPQFKAGDYDRGVQAGVDAVLGVIAGSYVADESVAEGSDIGARIIGLLIFLAVVGPFTFIAVIAPGFLSWFLYVFLMPFWALFPPAFLGETIGVPLFIVYGLGFLVMKFVLRRTPIGKKWSKKIAAAGIMSSSGRSGGSSWSSSSSSSSSSFSGGGGSFSGGGSSGSW